MSAPEKLKNAILRIYNNRRRWEPITLSRSLVEVTEIADQLHHKVAREIQAGKIKYYFLIHANDLEEGLLIENEYSFSLDNMIVVIGKFTWGDVYCVSMTVKM